MNYIDYSEIFRIYSKWDVPDEVILHMFRVAELVRKLLLRIVGNEEKLDLLIKAALLHDVGKALVKREILNKPGKLTTEEFEEMKRHVEFTVQILLEEKIDHRIIGYVQRHHERNNGSGYPNGLTKLSKLDEILAICDIYDAVTSNRPYRNKLSQKEAAEIIYDKKNAFDINFSKLLFDYLNEDEIYKTQCSVS